MNDTNKKFEFNKERHLYLLDGKPLTGCTTILGILAKPALIPWASKMCAEYIDNKVQGIMVEDDRMTPAKAWKVLEINWAVWLEEARKVHAKRKTDAGAYGTETHNKIELLILNAIKNYGGMILEEEVDIKNKSVQNFIDWSIKNKVKFLETEKLIYSENLYAGGTVDFVCEIDGQVWIGDIKTSGSGIYPEHFFQCAGYNLMLEDMGLYPNIIGYLILNLKENGEMLEKRSISNEENKKIFKNCLEIYRCQQ